MSLQSLKLGITYEQLIAVLNANFSDLQLSTEDISAISTALTNHNSDLAAHSNLFNTIIKQVSYEPTTGTFTFTKGDGTTVSVDTALERVVANFEYNSTSKSLELTLDDGTVQSVPMSDFIDTYAGSDTSTITVTVTAENTIQAVIKNSSLTWDMLSTALKEVINNKVDAVAGKGLSTKDFTAEYETKLTGIEANANNYVLPVGGNSLGGTKNGGNVVIGADGTLTTGKQLTFTSTEGWVTGEGGNYVLSLTSTAIPVSVYRFIADGQYSEVIVGVTRTATAISITASEKFAGYIQVI